jgi:hypothetical protein
MTTLNQADKIYLGSTLANALYVGATKVWPPFKPTDLSGLKVWLDASQLALAHGAAVSSWPNLAGAPNPTVFGSPAPTFQANALNTKLPVVRITGAQGRFRFTGTGVDKDYTLAFVARRWSFRAGRVITCPAATANILYGFWSTRSDCAYVEGWLTPDDVVTSTTGWKLYSGDATSTVGARLFVDGKLLRSGAATPAKGFGGTLNISGSDDAPSTEDADCEIAELIVYNRKLSDAERQQVEAYLRVKWGAPTLFKPTDLGSNLVAWFDGSDAASVTRVGDKVSQWINKGVGAMTLTQGTDANKPTYSSAGVNIITPQAFVSANAPASFDVVLASTPNVPGDWRTLLRSATGHEVIIESTTMRIGTYSGGFLPAGGLTWGNVDGIAYARVAPSTAVLISRDGGALTTTTTALGAGSAAPTMFGAYIAPPPSQGWGLIREIIFLPYNSDGYRQLLEGYLAHKWEMQSLLAAGHPFKNSPP